MSNSSYNLDVVVNRCYGGYGLSDEACRLIAERKGEPYSTRNGYPYAGETNILDLPRHDLDLVAVVKELGTRANGENAELKIAKMTVCVELSDHDGMENVHVYAVEGL